MASPFSTMFGSQMRQWLGTKGFVMVLVAALFPLILTGAWAATHQADVVAGTPTWDPATPVAGGNVTFTATVSNHGGAATGAFNATLVVGKVAGREIVPDALEDVRIDRLEPGATRTVELPWRAKAGAWLVVFTVDQDDLIGEIDEWNNQDYRAVAVHHATPGEEAGPTPPADLAGDENATTSADAGVVDVTWTPEAPADGDNVTLTATFTNDGPDALTNATATLRIGTMFGTSVFAQEETTETLNLSAGESVNLSVNWLARSGVVWTEAFVQVANTTADPSAANNHRAEPLAVQPTIPAGLQPPELPEKLTVKEFYLDILSLLYLPLLVPFIALFYAAGVVTDERERGNLPYLLTRPIPRWTLPVTKFLSGFIVAALAIVVGLVATFALLFGMASFTGTGSTDVGFLVAPLVVSLLALFAYGAFFTLVGVLSQRPYLVGIAFIVGWEVIVRLFLEAGNFAEWVKNLTISHHIGLALDAFWDPQNVLFRTMPEGADYVNALWILLGLGIAFVIASGEAMRRREFLG